ncbi:MAG: glycosyltransferase family 2 protein [Gelidibacter sp.]
MFNNLVSVIIPNYNSIEFIKETLDSVFNQSYPNIEVIVVDDSSTDSSLAYLESIEANNFILKRNIGKGACAARNFGIQLASGGFIQFLDSDDIISEDKIKKQMALLKESPKKIAVCRTKHFTETVANGVITGDDFLYTTDDVAGFLLNLYGANGTFQSVQTSAWLTPKSIIEKGGLWDETLKKDQDGEFFCRMVMASEGVLFEPKGLNYYRKHPFGTNIANQKQEIHFDSQLRALNSKMDQLGVVKDTDSYRKAMALQYKIIAIGAYPEHKTIYKIAIDTAKRLGGSTYEPVLGGKIIEIIKHIFGWRTAKSFSTFVHKQIIK